MRSQRSEATHQGIASCQEVGRGPDRDGGAPRWARLASEAAVPAAVALVDLAATGGALTCEEARLLGLLGLAVANLELHGEVWSAVQGEQDRRQEPAGGAVKDSKKAMTRPATGCQRQARSVDLSAVIRPSRRRSAPLARSRGIRPAMEATSSESPFATSSGSNASSSGSAGASYRFRRSESRRSGERTSVMPGLSSRRARQPLRTPPRSSARARSRPRRAWSPRRRPSWRPSRRCRSRCGDSAPSRASGTAS